MMWADIWFSFPHSMDFVLEMLILIKQMGFMEEKEKKYQMFYFYCFLENEFGKLCVLKGVY